MTFSNTNLFHANEMAFKPLADRMRPRTLDEFHGQDLVVGKNSPLRQAIEQDCLHSMVFWGPPGTGKTTLALMLAEHSGAAFIKLSAVLSGVKDIRGAIDEAKQHQLQGKPTVLFVDEVHRFNKSQQDAFLPHIENGTVIFVGATTENPSFELNNALLSRLRVYVLQALSKDDVIAVLKQALANEERGLANRWEIAKKDLMLIAMASDGDARRALNLLEIATDLTDNGIISEKIVKQLLSGRLRRFDKGGEAFYDQISALHKAVRGSNADAALYWLCRMLDGGCDPLYIARRVVRMASEDIGIADPRALQIALNAWDVQERLGSPEGELTLAQAVVYLAVAAKSNALYSAYNKAMRAAKESGSLEVPLHLRNAPTRLMKELGYGKEYRYAHDEPQAYAAGEQYLPDELEQAIFYQPTERGLEKKIAEKMAWLRSLDKKHTTRNG